MGFMPKLLGYTESINANVWDSFCPEWLSDKRCHDRLKLFANRPDDDPFCNVGNRARTSMSGGPYIIGDDQTFVILNWHARTNIEQRLSGDALLAWNDWVQATQATLVLGSMWVNQLPLSELLARPPTWGSTWDSPREIPMEIPFPIPNIRAKAERMYEAYAEKLRCRPGYEFYSDGRPVTWNQLLVDGNAVKWGDLSDEQRGHWIHAARFPHVYEPVVVPVRASVTVDITTDQKTLTMFRRYMPEQAMPLPLVWIHLAGIARRFTA